MNVVVNGRNVEVTQTLRSYAEDKITKFEKYLSNITEAVITLSIQKYRHKAEVLLKANGNIIQAEGVTDELYSAIDDVAQKLERQIKKLKGKLQTHRKPDGKSRTTAPAAAAEEAAAASETGRIIKKPLSTKPMSPDEAAIQMEINNQEFLVFTNDQSGDINVIYRRSDGNLGLIEPAK
jgi:putative sigma-54 modulation protein